MPGFNWAALGHELTPDGAIWERGAPVSVWTAPPVTGPSVKSQLREEIRQRDAQIRQLTEKARELRRHKGGHSGDLLRRLQQLEAHLLTAKVVPTESRREMVPAPMWPVQEPLTLEEMEELHKHSSLLDGGDEDDDEESDDDLIGLPALPPLPPLPDGARLADVRIVKGPQMPPGGIVVPIPPPPPPPPPAALPPPVLQGQLIDSNYALTPSPYHPVGPWAQSGLLSNVYPITRPPPNCANEVLERRLPEAAPEQQWTAYADFFDARRFPTGYREQFLDYIPDEGLHLNRQWRAAPRVRPPLNASREERIAARVCASIFPV